MHETKTAACTKVTKSGNKMFFMWSRKELIINTLIVMFHTSYRFIIWFKKKKKKRLGLAQLVLRNGFHDLEWPASQYQAHNQVCTVKNAQWRHRAQSNVWGKNGKDGDGEESWCRIFSTWKTLNPLMTDWRADTEVKASHQFLIQVIFKRKGGEFSLKSIFFFFFGKNTSQTTTSAEESCNQNNLTATTERFISPWYTVSRELHGLELRSDGHVFKCTDKVYNTCNKVLLLSCEQWVPLFKSCYG